MFSIVRTSFESRAIGWRDLCLQQVNVDPVGHWPFARRQHAQQRRLAAAVHTEQTVAIAIVEFKLHRARETEKTRKKDRIRTLSTTTTNENKSDLTWPSSIN